jgi:hypothetical protein
MSVLRPRLWSVLLLLLAISPVGAQEPVAVLYGHDGKSLYRINASNGKLSTIGDLDRYIGAGRDPSWYFTRFQSLTYDAAAHKLYALGAWGDGTPSEMMLARIDPISAAAEKVADLGQRPPQNIGYDWPLRALCLTTASTIDYTAVSKLDPQTGEQSLLNRGTGIYGFQFQTTFFDGSGHLWVFSRDDYAALLQQYSLSESEGKRLFQIEGTIYDPATYGLGTWPNYQSFSFHPSARILFATFVTGLNGTIYGDWQTSLCIVNLKTGKPSKIIATYSTPNWPLQISWGMSQ